MKRVFVSFVALAAVAVLEPACAGAEGEGEGENEPACTEPTDVRCRDQSFQALGMSDDLTPGAVTDEASGDTHTVHVDATAGGYPPDEGFVYGKFTDDGFVKVDVLDDQSFDSMDWDLGFRRFVIRMNSGVAGPSCVTGANLGAGDAFDDVTEAPGASDFQAESYYDDQCTFLEDDSGLPTAPATVTQNFWQYSTQSCLQMTGNVYVLELADGRFVKMEVIAYYQTDAGDPLTAQEECNDEGAPVSPNRSAHIRFRWAFL